MFKLFRASALVLFQTGRAAKAGDPGAAGATERINGNVAYTLTKDFIESY